MKIDLGHVLASLGAALWLVVVKAVSTEARIRGVALMQRASDYVARGILLLGFVLLAICVFLSHALQSDGLRGKK